MQDSKIRLSPAEAALFCNAETILTKNSILQKTVDLLGGVQLEFLELAPSSFRHLSPPPKISKGENYLGLPYVILDYPRIAKGADLLFIRSMFWWGNFYSSTLQLSGSYKQAFEERIITAYEEVKERSYAAGINTDPWVHHFGADNYKPVHELSRNAFAALISERPHIKIAASWPLSEWDRAAINLAESWKFFAGLIT